MPPPLTIVAPVTRSDFQLRSTRQPMFWAAMAYSLGIVAGVHTWRPTSWWMAAALAFLAASLYFLRRRPWLSAALALGAFFLAGALQIQLAGSELQTNATLQPWDGQPVELIAHVTREGKFREAASGEIRQTLDVDTEEIAGENGKHTSLRAGVRLGIYSTLLSQTRPRLYRYGERVHLAARLKLPRNFRNPGAFDYQSYLAANGIVALASAKAEDVQLLPGFTGNRLELWRARIHSSILAKVQALWPPAQAALIDAMVIGEEAFIDPSASARLLLLTN